MREVIQLHLGQAGIQMASSCWELFCLEHDIQPDGTIPNDKVLEGIDSHLESLFSQSSNGKCVPRAIMFDEDTQTIDAVKNSPFRTLFNPSNIHQCKTESGGNWARANKIIFHSENGDLLISKVNKLLEGCDACSGVVIYHSLDGGFGGGFTTKLLEKLKDDIGKVTKTTISIMPSKYSYSNVAYYNTILTLPQIQEFTNFNILLDNNALYQVCERQLDIDYPNFPIINRMIAQMSSSLTQSSRFGGQKFVDLIEMNMHLVPDPNLKLIHASYAPFINVDKSNTELVNLSQITNSLFDERSSFIGFDHSKTKYIASTLMFRGDCPQKDIGQTLSEIKSSATINFVDWAPINYQLAITFKSPVAFPQSEQGKSNKSVCMLANSTGIQEPLNDIAHNFDLQYAKRGFVHWFVGEGMEEGEFSECRESVQTSLKNYEEAGKEEKKEEEEKKEGEQEENG